MNEQTVLINQLYDIFRRYNPNEQLLKFYIDDLMNGRELSLEALTELLGNEENAHEVATEVNKLLGTNLILDHSEDVLESSNVSNESIETLREILSNPDYYISGVATDNLIRDILDGEEIDYGRITSMVHGNLDLASQIFEIIERIQGKTKEVDRNIETDSKHTSLLDDSHEDIETLRSILSNPDYYIMGVAANNLIRDVLDGEEIDYGRITSMVHGNLDLASQIFEMIERIQGKAKTVESKVETEKEEVDVPVEVHEEKSGDHGLTEAEKNSKRDIEMTAVPFDEFENLHDFETRYGLDHSILNSILSEIMLTGTISPANFEKIWADKQIQSETLGTEPWSEEEQNALKEAFFTDLLGFLTPIAKRTQSAAELSSIINQVIAKKTELNSNQMTQQEEKSEQDLMIEQAFSILRRCVKDLKETLDKLQVEMDESLLNGLSSQVQAVQNNILYLKGNYDKKAFDKQMDVEEQKEILAILTQGEVYNEAYQSLAQYVHPTKVSTCLDATGFKNYLDSSERLQVLYTEKLRDAFRKTICLHNQPQLLHDEKQVAFVNELYEKLKEYYGTESGFTLNGYNPNDLTIDSLMGDLSLYIDNYESFINEISGYGLPVDEENKNIDLLMNEKTQEMHHLLIDSSLLYVKTFNEQAYNNIVNQEMNQPQVNEQEPMEQTESVKNPEDTKGETSENVQDNVEPEYHIARETEDIIEKYHIVITPDAQSNPKYQEFLAACQDKLLELNRNTVTKIALPEKGLARLRRKKTKDKVNRYNTVSEDIAQNEATLALGKIYNEYFDTTQEGLERLKTLEEHIAQQKEGQEQFIKENPKMKSRLFSEIQPELKLTYESESKALKLPENTLDSFHRASGVNKELTEKKNEILSMNLNNMFEEGQKYVSMSDNLLEQQKQIVLDKEDASKIIVALSKNYEEHKIADEENLTKEMVADIIAPVEKTILDIHSQKSKDGRKQMTAEIEQLANAYNHFTASEFKDKLVSTVTNLEKYVEEEAKITKEQKDAHQLGTFAINQFISKSAKDNFENVTDKQKEEIHKIQIFNDDVAHMIKKSDRNHKLDVYLDENGNIQEVPEYKPEKVEEPKESEKSNVLSQLKEVKVTLQQKDKDMEALEAALRANGLLNDNNSLDDIINVGRELQEKLALMDQEQEEQQKGRSK